MREFLSELKDSIRGSVITGISAAVVLFITAYGSWLLWAASTSVYDPQPQQVESKTPPPAAGSNKPSAKPSPKKESQKSL